MNQKNPFKNVKRNHNSSIPEKVIRLSCQMAFSVIPNATAGGPPMTSRRVCSITRKSNRRNVPSIGIDIKCKEVFSLDSRQQSLPLDTANETTLQITTEIWVKRVSVTDVFVYAQGLCDNISSTDFFASPSKYLECKCYRT